MGENTWCPFKISTLALKGKSRTYYISFLQRHGKWCPMAHEKVSHGGRSVSLSPNSGACLGAWEEAACYRRTDTAEPGDSIFSQTSLIFQPSFFFFIHIQVLSYTSHSSVSQMSVGSDPDTSGLPSPQFTHFISHALNWQAVWWAERERAKKKGSVKAGGESIFLDLEGSCGRAMMK